MRTNAAGLGTWTLVLLSVMATWGTTMARDGQTEEGRRSRKERKDNAPKVGDVAPTFTLKSLDGKSETDLATYRGRKPVVLFFGSYT